jgi:hypothetical protein
VNVVVLLVRSACCHGLRTVGDEPAQPLQRPALAQPLRVVQHLQSEQPFQSASALALQVFCSLVLTPLDEVQQQRQRALTVAVLVQSVKGGEVREGDGEVRRELEVQQLLECERREMKGEGTGVC